MLNETYWKYSQLAGAAFTCAVLADKRGDKGSFLKAKALLSKYLHKCERARHQKRTDR
jgi:hypothetical protein